jgi:prepilin-type N-terminal cleavage/methylation domain-containing protein
MNWRSQRGMTLVEVLVGMVVTSIVLIGLTGVLYNVTGRYQAWVDRVNTASIGLGLAASIQADSHRYVLCAYPGPGTDQELDLCVPGDSTPAVKYNIAGGQAPWLITRTEGSGTATFMARGLGSRPYFRADCGQQSTGQGPGAASGHIHIYQLRMDQQGSRETYSVYYRAPGSCP